MARVSKRLDVPLMAAVGAAFDFHAGRISQGASLDAGARARVDLPHRSGAAAAPTALPLYNPAFVMAFARQLARERLGRRTS